MALPKWSMLDIQERLFNRPLMVSRQKAQIALGVMGPKLNISGLVLPGADGHHSLDQLKAQASTAKAEMEVLPGDDKLKAYEYDWATDTVREKAPYEVWNGVAIFSVRGSLMAENGLNPASGATGYDGLNRKARYALDDAAVLGGILDIDSPGGEVVDLQETCNHFRAFAEKKPLRAVVRGQAASAGYALAACAGKGNITAAPYSIVGSIGAIMLHADFSKQLEDAGIDVTMIASAAHKTDGSQLQPLAADVAARLQAMVDSCAATFIEHVAESRGVSTDSLIAQEARFYSGQEALNLGLIDKFLPWDKSMHEFAQSLNSSGSRRTATAPSGVSSSKGKAMSTQATAPAAEQQPIFTQAQLDEAVATATATAAADATTASANAERARFSALAELDGGSKISAELAAAVADGTSAGDFAIAQAKAAKAKAGIALANARADALAQGELPEGGAAAATAMAEDAPVNRGDAYVNKRRAAAAAQ